MAFSATAVNYAKEYSAGLEQIFPYALHFGALYAAPNNGKYRFTGPSTIEVPTISVAGRVDANRDSIVAKSRKFNNAWTPLALSNQRMWETLVHPKDIDQTNMAVSIQNLTQVMNNEQKFPEMDCYCISKIYADFIAASRAPDALVLTISNVLTEFDALMERMTESRVPAAGRILYVIPAVDTLLKSAAGISRTMDIANASPAIQRAIAYLDSVTIEVVPSDLMKTVYVFTEGWVASGSAKQIQMALIHPNAIITPTSYEFAQLDAPSAGSGGKYDYYEESHEDVFILPQKATGVEFVIEDTVLPALNCTSTAGAEVGDTLITIVSTKTTGSIYMYKTGAGAQTLPGYGDAPLTGYAEFDPAVNLTIATGQHIGVIEVDADNRTIKGSDKTVTAKASQG